MQPIFQTIFGDNWKKLPPVMHKHYANRPFSNDVVTVKGALDIEFSRMTLLLSPLLRIFGALVPHQGLRIPVTVHFRSEPDSSVFCFDRIFHFRDRKPYRFFSRLVPIKDDVVIEFMRFGIGWEHTYQFNNGKVVLTQRGYVWKIFGYIIPIPLGLLFGRGYAEEEALTDTTFKMKVNLIHPLFGKMYEYRGEFGITDE